MANNPIIYNGVLTHAYRIIVRIFSLLVIVMVIVVVGGGGGGSGSDS